MSIDKLIPIKNKNIYYIDDEARIIINVTTPGIMNIDLNIDEDIFYSDRYLDVIYNLYRKITPVSISKISRYSDNIFMKLILSYFGTSFYSPSRHYLETDRNKIFVKSENKYNINTNIHKNTTIIKFGHISTTINMLFTEYNRYDFDVYAGVEDRINSVMLYTHDNVELKPVVIIDKDGNNVLSIVNNIPEDKVLYNPDNQKEIIKHIDNYKLITLDKIYIDTESIDRKTKYDDSITF